MSTNTVCVLCPNGHRVYVAVSPSTLLNTIKQQACEKHAYNPSQFGLRKEDFKKPLDLSFTFRLSGLSNKAKLELFEQEQKNVLINIALQLETGLRLQGRMFNNSSIAQTIECIGKGITEVSYVIYLDRKINKDAFNSVTLSDLGILKGSALLRLHGVKQHLTSQTAMETDTPCIKSEAEVVSVSGNSTKIESDSMSIEETKIIETDLVKEDEIISTIIMPIIDKSPILFDPTKLANEDVDLEMESDDFYEVTDRDMLTLLRDLHKLSEREFKFKEKEAEKTIPDDTVLRIRFRNGYVLQQIFDTKKTTTDTLYAFVKDYITSDTADNLALFLAPPKYLIKQGISLLDAGLTSTTLLHAGGDITMKADLTIATDASATQQLSSVLTRNSQIMAKSTGGKPQTIDEPQIPQTSKQTAGKSGKSVPKWFKMK